MERLDTLQKDLADGNLTDKQKQVVRMMLDAIYDPRLETETPIDKQMLRLLFIGWYVDNLVKN